MSDVLEPQDDQSFDRIEDAIEAIRQGKLVIVVDDEDRENEGDFVCAAEAITPELVNFMVNIGRGLVCVPITRERMVELNLDMMVSSNTSLHETGFTVSVDYKLGRRQGFQQATGPRR